MKLVYVSTCNIEIATKDPKNILPTSPINIFDGCQFHNKNPNIEKENAI